MSFVFFPVVDFVLFSDSFPISSRIFVSVGLAFNGIFADITFGYLFSYMQFLYCFSSMSWIWLLPRILLAILLSFFDCFCPYGLFIDCSLQWRHNDHDGVSNHQPHHCLLVYSDADQRKHQSCASLVLVGGIHRGPTQMASDAENVSIWWRHHVCIVVPACCLVPEDRW